MKNEVRLLGGLLIVAVIIFSVILVRSCRADVFAFPSDTTIWNFGDTAHVEIDSIVAPDPVPGHASFHWLALCWPNRPENECKTLYMDHTASMDSAMRINIRLPAAPPDFVQHDYGILKWQRDTLPIVEKTVHFALGSPVLPPGARAARKVEPAFYRDTLGRSARPWQWFRFW
jgi:hypothetical protein